MMTCDNKGMLSDGGSSRLPVGEWTMISCWEPYSKTDESCHMPIHDSTTRLLKSMSGLIYNAVGPPSIRITR